MIRKLFIAATLALVSGGAAVAAPVSVAVRVTELRVMANGSLIVQTPQVATCAGGLMVPLGDDEQSRRKFSRIYRLLLSSGYSKLPVVIVYEAESAECLVSNVAGNF